MTQLRKSITGYSQVTERELLPISSLNISKHVQEEPGYPVSLNSTLPMINLHGFETSPAEFGTDSV